MQLPGNVSLLSFPPSCWWNADLRAGAGGVPARAVTWPRPQRAEPQGRRNLGPRGLHGTKSTQPSWGNHPLTFLHERETSNLVKPLFWVPCHLQSNQVLINIVVELELKPVWLQRPKLTNLTCCFYCTTLYPRWFILLWSVFHSLHLENHSINIYQVPGSELENKPRI